VGPKSRDAARFEVKKTQKKAQRPRNDSLGFVWGTFQRFGQSEIVRTDEIIVWIDFKGHVSHTTHPIFLTFPLFHIIHACS